MCSPALPLGNFVNYLIGVWERSGCNFRNFMFNLDIFIGIYILSYDNTLRWMLCELTEDKSALVQGTNGLVPHEPMLTQNYVTVYHHLVMMT